MGSNIWRLPYGNGLGTHVSGTAAEKSASLIAVKVSGDDGDIISGLNWVYNAVQTSNRPSIATMSLGGSASSALDNAVASLTNAGIHVTVAAGNSNVDAGDTSPARAPSANTIGATSIADARASFSNYGSVVDLFAPGQDITSTWIGDPKATNTISGTSMATPHVAGLVAYLSGLKGNVSPATMSSYLNSLSVKGVISGIRLFQLREHLRATHIRDVDNFLNRCYFHLVDKYLESRYICFLSDLTEFCNASVQHSADKISAVRL